METLFETTCRAIMSEFWTKKSPTRKTLKEIIIRHCKGSDQLPAVYFYHFVTDIPKKAGVMLQGDVYRIFLSIRQYFTEEKAKELFKTLAQEPNDIYWHTVNDKPNPQCIRTATRLQQLNPLFDYRTTNGTFDIILHIS